MGWQFWVDRGGTFTDIVAYSPDGRIMTSKLLSENPEHYQDAAVEGIRRLLNIPKNAPFPSQDIDAIKMGTTVATNALLERGGEKTLLAITKGFADVLTIGTQQRPSLFELNIRRPSALYSDVIEINERLLATGDVEKPLNESDASHKLKKAFAKGYRSVAIVLLHADRHPQHESHVAELAKKIGFTQISTSHDVIPLMRVVSRGETTVADAYLSPILSRYVNQIRESIGNTRLFFMQSNGGLTDAVKFRGKDSVLSGPAGGVVGMAGIAKDAGIDKVIGFDMGGTSTDVSHYAGTFERSFDSVVAGVKLRAPMMDIHTVAAGGGSCCVFDGLRLRVGPESASANPGPTAYRRDGPLTVTDCNILLGRIQPKYFPNVFGKCANQPLDLNAVQRKFSEMAQTVNSALGEKKSEEMLAQGFLDLAIENMANAIKTISVQKGHDVSGYTLVSFGGAGGQHACRVADVLGMTQVLVHRYASVLSAYGMGLGALRALREQTVSKTLDQANLAQIGIIFEELTAAATQDLLDQGVPEQQVEVIKQVHVRYDGSDTGLPVSFDPPSNITKTFERLHEDLFGFIQDGKALVIETASVEAFSRRDSSRAVQSLSPMSPEAKPPRPIDNIDMWSESNWITAPVFDAKTLEPGRCISGPALITASDGTIVVEANWQCHVQPQRDFLLKRAAKKAARIAIGTHADAIQIEIFNSLFMSIAEQMGAVLQNTAHSVNIKERLDFSCAVFDSTGALVANAPHMPVHLGSMGESVRAVIQAQKGRLKPQSAFVTNAPYNGGTHLPDITVVMPMFDKTSGELIFFVAARGHHADIGGLTPGSMPPNSHNILEEGVLLDALPLVVGGQFLEQEMRQILSGGSYPSRNVSQNIADLRAQLAACNKGAKELQKVVNEYGLDVVKAFTQHVQDNAEEAVRRVLDSLTDGRFTAPMDDGGEIHVSIAVNRQDRSAIIDFTGTSPQRPTNYNAPSAICKAAVLYVFRTLVNDDIPMNEGCLKPLSIIIPEGSMLNPAHPAAVVAGNVETSQIVCDALYAALGRLAASQGTMNNLTFGNAEHQYYETLCGGTGASADFDGADAVHSHMTNSRLTDPEILEWRYPVIVDSFSIRANSGGAGHHCGGHGAVRKIRFLDSMSVAILSGRRTTSPFGLNGGEDGLCGETLIERVNGDIEALAYSDAADVQSGDRIIVKTPGGGGYGSKN
ncbi:MAG: hydantoinase B/oxoprolinase family protein [Rhodospirillaceae bacterium]